MKKMVKIYKSTSLSTPSEREPYDPDESMESQQSTSRWSLISLCNNEGQNIELKFVDKMKRQFQFSVDAFQVHLNSLLDYYDCQDSMRVQADCAATQSTTHQVNKMTENVYPTVLAESMYGEFEESNYHLNNKLIATKSPEEIRGGGLLKYCNLLIKGMRLFFLFTLIYSTLSWIVPPTKSSLQTSNCNLSIFKGLLKYKP